MKKSFNHVTILIILILSSSFFSCFTDNEEEKDPPAYLQQAHILLFNEVTTGKSITSFTINSNEILNSSLPAGYYLHVWDTVAANDIDISITDNTAGKWNYLDRDIPLGKVLIFDYYGTGVSEWPLEDASDWGEYLE